MKPITHILLLLLSGIAALAALTSCGSSNKHEEPPVPATPRTVLVYMVATNNLGGYYDLADLNEMDVAARNGFPGGARLVVYYASNNAAPQLLEITAQGRQVLKTYTTDLKSVSAQRMIEVINDTKIFAPALHYGMMFWSHASGWIEDGIEEPDLNLYSFGYDYQVLNAMNTTTMAKVLEGRGIDFAYFDCCYMGGVEVAYELRNAVETIVASPAELPANGSPYDLILPYLMREEADCVSAARVTFEDYQKAYDNGDDTGCTLSVVKTSELEGLAQAVKDLYILHPEYDTDTPVQEFQNNRRNYYDLGDYLSKLRMPDSEQPLDLTAVNAALDRAVIYKAATPGIHMTQVYPITAYCGLSTYILRAASESGRTNYDHLAWYRDVAIHLFN